jgi:hypothetical protein
MAAVVASDQELADLIALGRGADSVELKLTVPIASGHRAAGALGLDPLDGEIRQVYFFDTPDLALEARGLVLRARRSQRRGDDSVVKLRPVVPDQVPDELHASPSFVIEVDAMPGGFVCSGSMKRALPKPAVRPTVQSGRAIRKLFSKEQRALFDAHAPDGIELDELEVLGPILVLKLKYAPEGYPRKLAAELWVYPDGSMVAELSTRCGPAEAFQVAAEVRAFLVGRGVDFTGEQQTKTKKALEFFSAQLREG